MMFMSEEAMVCMTCISVQVEIEVEAAVRDTDEDDDAVKMNAEELRRFDELLKERERQRQIDQGMRWKP
jgi:hypothetical protein